MKVIVVLYDKISLKIKNVEHWILFVSNVNVSCAMDNVHSFMV